MPFLFDRFKASGVSFTSYASVSTSLVKRLLEGYPLPHPPPPPGREGGTGCGGEARGGGPPLARGGGGGWLYLITRGYWLELTKAFL
jgi:hypothetical protein